MTQRINKGIHKGIVTMFGNDGDMLPGNIISIDYAMFDKLDDDGVAVLIAEAIALKSIQPTQPGNNSITERDILKIDELAGRYVALAGFESSGFIDYLNNKISFNMDSSERLISGESRTGAFMRGYLSVGSN